MEEQLANFTSNTSKDELLLTFTMWLRDSETYHQHLLRFQNQSEQYYIGNQTERDAIQARGTGNSDTVENRIFEGVETIVPIATQRPHQFVVLPGSENELSVQRANNLQKILSRKYETLEMQKKLERTTRDMLLYRFGVNKWEWNYEKDDIDVRVIDPRLILVPKMRLDPKELPYKIEIQEYTRKEMKEYFPNVEIEDLTPEDRIQVGDSGKTYKRKYYRVYEVWAYGQTVAWFCSNKVLDVQSNPYYDFEGTEKKYLNPQKKKGKIKIDKRR